MSRHYSSSLTYLTSVKLSEKFIQTGGDKSIHLLYYENPHSTLSFFLIHGRSVNQEATHWAPHFEFFAKLGSFYAVDLLGHGRSSGVTSLPEISDHAFVLRLVLTSLGINPENDLVIIGRGLGGAIVIEMLKLVDAPSALVLISPIISTQRLDAVAHVTKTLPVQMFWAEDDMHNDFYENSPAIQKALPKSVMKSYVDTPVTGDQDDWKTHAPELSYPESFRQTLEAFLTAQNLSPSVPRTPVSNENSKKQ